MTQRDIRKRFDEIVAFSEVEQFLDTPVKRYSSGMYVRLAFAVAAHLEPGSWDLLEALQPDPTRPDALTWITSYDTLYNTPGVPLVDFKPIGKSGRDPRMLFSWYSADLCTDLAFTGLAPEQCANPSMGSWPDAGYLEQQKLRLPTSKYRRLHLNLPGAPAGAFLDQGSVLAAVFAGRRALPPEEQVRYRGFVDLSGGSSDDAVLAIAHQAGKRIVVDLVEKQAGGVPFNPRDAVAKFSEILRRFRVSRVVGDAYAGETFRRDFQAHGIMYERSQLTASELYEALEPRLNAGEVELPDLPVLTEQLLTLVQKGARVTHENGALDDHANACAGAVQAAAKPGYDSTMQWVTGPDLDAPAAAESAGGVHYVDLAISPSIGPPVPAMWRSPYWR